MKRTSLPLLAMLAAMLVVLPAHASAQDAPRGLRAARTLARGDTLAATDIVADSGTKVGPESVVGWVTRRVISEGELLRPPGIGHAVAIRAGAAVEVRAIVGNITVSRFGVAMFDAGLGDSVRVRLGTRAMVVGVVRDRDTVILP